MVDKNTKPVLASASLTCTGPEVTVQPWPQGGGVARVDEAGLLARDAAGTLEPDRVHRGAHDADVPFIVQPHGAAAVHLPGTWQILRTYNRKQQGN